MFLVAALALTACPSGKKCTTNADCTGGEVCSVMSGTCVTGTGMGGGIGGGGIGGGTGAGGGGGTGGGTGGGSNMNNGAETCEMAMLITPGTITGSTVGLASDYDPGCTGDVTPGPDTVYKISVPAGQRLTATATPATATMGNQFDLALYIISAPASNCSNPDGGTELSCEGASDDPNALQTPETAGYFNGTANAVEVFIVVDSFFETMNNNPDGGIGASNEGNFTLVTTIAPPPMGDRCDTAVTLVSGTPLANQDMAAFGDDYSGSGMDCEGSNAADATYKIDVPAGQLLSIAVTPDMTFDPTISIADSEGACDVTCLDSIDVGSDGDVETLNYKNVSGATQSVHIVIDGYQGSTGTFSITATLSTPPTDDVCMMPTALVAGTPATAQTISNYTNDYTTGTGCGFVSGNDRAYSIAVPVGQRVTVTVTPTAMANPTISLVDTAANCGVACVASATSALTGSPEVLAFTNRSGMAQTYLVIVDFSAASMGTFDIVATVATPPADDVCEAPTVVTAGTPVTGTTIGYTNDYQNGTGTVGCAESVTGFDRVYQVAVPANQRGIVSVTPTADAGYNPSINLVEGAAAVCSAMPRVCVAGNNSAGANLTESVSIYNTTGAAKNYFAIVDSAAGVGGDFSFGYTTATPSANDTCTTTTTSTAMGTLTGQNMTGFVNDYPSGVGCRTARGPDRVYRVNLAVNERYTVTTTPTDADGGFDPVINFVPGPASNCESGTRTCRGGADATLRGQAETASFTNNSGAALELYVLVADWEAVSLNRDFTLLSTIAPVTAGESCGVPQVATAGMLAAQTTMGASSDVTFNSMSMGCVPTGSSPDKVYSVSVPAGQTLTVTATPALDEDLIINIIDGAAAVCNNVLMCADSADVGFDGDPEVATFMNATGAAKTVFVQLAGYGANLNYSLNVQIQ